MFVLTLLFYFKSKSQRNLVATLATNPEFLVAKEKMLVALVTVSVTILSPVCVLSYLQYMQSFKQQGGTPDT